MRSWTRHGQLEHGLAQGDPARPMEPPARRATKLTAQHTLVQIRACHEREYRANERVQRVDCVDSVFVIVRVISVPVSKGRAQKKKEKKSHEGDCECSPNHI